MVTFSTSRLRACNTWAASAAGLRPPGLRCHNAPGTTASATRPNASQPSQDSWITPWHSPARCARSCCLAASAAARPLCAVSPPRRLGRSATHSYLLQEPVRGPARGQAAPAPTPLTLELAMRHLAASCLDWPRREKGPNSAYAGGQEASQCGKSAVTLVLKAFRRLGKALKRSNCHIFVFATVLAQWRPPIGRCANAPTPADLARRSPWPPAMQRARNLPSASSPHVRDIDVGLQAAVVGAAAQARAAGEDGPSGVGAAAALQPRWPPGSQGK